jgi:succinate dehydrogenase / fumarate reductase flavoprotein subunit
VKGVLVTESVRGEGGLLLNNKGERFMFKYIPEKFAAETADTEEEATRWLQGDKNARRPPELLTRDVVARAIKKEVEEGRGSPHGGVFLDIASRRPADFIKKKLPSMYHQFKELAEVDITKEPMEVGPTLHYFMGGIRVDSDTQATNVPGLFACGECGGGMHGANRLGGNSLSDLLVFGKLAGAGAADYVKKVSQGKIDEIQATAIMRRATAFLNKEEGLNPFVVQEDLQKVMQQLVGIVRLGTELQKALAEIERVKKDIEKVKAHASPQFNPGWNAAIDLNNLIVTAEAVTMAALAREESRGGHSRIDFQGEHEEGLTYNVVLKKDQNGKIQLQKVARVAPPKELADIAYAKIEDLEGKKADG